MVATEEQETSLMAETIIDWVLSGRFVTGAVFGAAVLLIVLMNTEE